MIWLCSVLLISQIEIERHTQETISTVLTGPRYQIIQSTLAAKWTFRVDTHTGRVWQFVKANDGNSWDEMRVDFDRIPGVKPRYQLFLSGIAAKFTFLIDSETGMTWQLVTSPDSENSLQWVTEPKSDAKDQTAPLGRYVRQMNELSGTSPPK